MPEPCIEPWLRGSHSELPAAARAVLHALELAADDLAKWCEPLTDAEVNATPHGLPSIAFQLRHLARSTDRLLSYAEGNPLSAGQIAMMKSEQEPGATKAELLSELEAVLKLAAERVRAMAATSLESPRGVGKKQLPTTVGGLLVHVADHGQRHVGQAVTTAKLLIALR